MKKLANLHLQLDVISTQISAMATYGTHIFQIGQRLSSEDFVVLR